ncbi:hypothetical protein MJG53_005107, partial [Ovis ammon polii x Ovis aries]
MTIGNACQARWLATAAACFQIYLHIIDSCVVFGFDFFIRFRSYDPSPPPVSAIMEPDEKDYNGKMDKVNAGTSREEELISEEIMYSLEEMTFERILHKQTGRKEKGDPLNIAIDKMTKKTRDLRRQLRKAVMDHISDSFLETNVPLLVLIEAAKSGNEKEVKEYAQVFREHANKLVE